MNMKNSKWTHEFRTHLFRTMVTKFGPYSEWTNRSYPLKEKKADFEQTLQELASYFQSQGAKIGSKKNPDGVEAVRQQLEWGITKQPIQRQLTWVHNKSAAAEVGFISQKEV